MTDYLFLALDREQQRVVQRALVLFVDTRPSREETIDRPHDRDIARDVLTELRYSVR